MADLEIRDLHVRIEEREILSGVDLDIYARRDPRADGPQRLGQVDAREHAARAPLVRDHRGHDHLQGRGHHRGRAARAREGGPVPRLPVPGLDPRRVGRELPAHGDQRQARGADPGQGVPHPAAARDRAARRRPRVHLAPPQRRLLRRREEARGDPADGDARPGRRDPRRDRLGARHRRAADGRRGRAAPARRAGPGRADHHPLPAHPALRQAPVRAHPDGRADRAARAASSWSSASSARATTRSARSSAPAG